MKITKLSLLKVSTELMLVYLLAVPVQAAEIGTGDLVQVLKTAVQTTKATQADGLLQALKTRYPSTTFTAVKDSGLAGIYEVYMGRNIAYTDSTGQLFLFGHLFDMAAQRDLTAERLDVANRLDFNALPLKDAIKTVRGDGHKIVAVFSDPDCPYCKRLEHELATVNDITVYTFLMPLEQLHPQAKSKAVAVWCAQDREQAWSLLMLQGKPAKSASCDNPIDRNIALAAGYGIQGTPTLVSGDGRLKGGVLTSEEISAWLEPSQKVSKVQK